MLLYVGRILLANEKIESNVLACMGEVLKNHISFVKRIIPLIHGGGPTPM